MNKRSLLERLVDIWDYCFNDDRYPLSNEEHEANICKVEREMIAIKKGEFGDNNPDALSCVTAYDKIFIKTAADRIMRQNPRRKDLKFLAKHVGRKFLEEWEKKLENDIAAPKETPCQAIATIPCRALMVIKTQTKP